MTTHIELALGTVQFGTAYGIAGRGLAVPEGEVRAILALAADRGIRVLDTAPNYGDIEDRLAHLVGDLPFEIVSKISALPPHASIGAAGAFVAESIARSIGRLGSRLSTLLFHREDDLFGPCGDAMWRAAETASRGGLRLGVSCYGPETAIALRRRYAIAVAQLPGNAFDQRLAVPGVADGLQGVEIHLRSVFLQGLLVMPQADAVERIPAAVASLGAWSAWCSTRGVRPVTAALGIAKSLPGVRLCVVGVDRLEHLDEILRAWDEAVPCSAAALASTSPDVIDPRRWTTA